MAPPRSVHTLLQSSERLHWKSRAGLGRSLLLLTALCLALGGLIIMTIGMTRIFVPQDLVFMGLERARIDEINPRLAPLIAHDRAGFGGAVATCGVTMFFCLWCGRRSRHLWQAVAFSGAAGFSTAILIHPAIGYNDFIHLLPASIGAVLFIAGLALSYGSLRVRQSGEIRL
jgi:hypothetical protein